MKRGLLFLMMLVLCVACFSDIGISSSNQEYQETWREYRITFDDSDQLAPAIWADKIVYMDERNGNLDIYLFNLSSGKEEPLVTEPHHQSYPDIYEDKVVYADMRNGNSDIYLYNLSTGIETAICTNPATQWRPHVYGDRVIWIDNRSGRWDVYMYDLSTEKEKRISNGSSYNPPFVDIFDEIIVWDDDRNYEPNEIWREIYMYNLDEEREIRVTDNSHKMEGQGWPAVYDDIIVWARGSANQKSGYDLVIYRISTKEKRVITSLGIHYFPDIYKNKVVWDNCTEDNVGDIYMYDLSVNESIPICRRPGTQADPKIYGNKVVWEDYRNGNWDVYLYTNESVNVPTQNQNKQNCQGIAQLLREYHYILIAIVVSIAVIIPFIYYKLKTKRMN